MKSLKDKVRKVLKSRFDVSYIIRYKEQSKDRMDKKLFIEIVEQLRKIEDRTDFLADEIGLDMSVYENTFFNVIENLFKIAFNKQQRALIQMYLYQLVPDKEWDGTITFEIPNKEKQTLPFRTPEDVWKVIKDL